MIVPWFSYDFSLWFWFPSTDALKIVLLIYPTISSRPPPQPWASKKYEKQTRSSSDLRENNEWKWLKWIHRNILKPQSYHPGSFRLRKLIQKRVNNEAKKPVGSVGRRRKSSSCFRLTAFQDPTDWRYVSTICLAIFWGYIYPLKNSPYIANWFNVHPKILMPSSILELKKEIRHWNHHHNVRLSRYGITF